MGACLWLIGKMQLPGTRVSAVEAAWATDDGGACESIEQTSRGILHVDYPGRI